KDITEAVLRNAAIISPIAFVWTNILMFTLRFFAGPIVHRVWPVGLLFAGAVLGPSGVLLLGMPATDTAWLWMAAVTVYGIGKTFYWPTMLGVISERFPRGGALALGFSGGVGMLSAGILGGPVIGYEQDYAATSQLKQVATQTYARYKAEKPTSPLPALPEVAGLDNGKVGVLDDYMGIQRRMEEARKKGETLKPEDTKLQLQTDLEKLSGQQLEASELKKRMQWWESE